MRLSINIDHVATVRQARLTDEPDPVRAAVLAELGGADGITVHLREDRRHISDRDVRLLRETIRTELNLELSTDPEMVAVAEGVAPDQGTLVPERREELTTEGGLALEDAQVRHRVAEAAGLLRERGVRTSLFVDPEDAAVDAAAELSVDAVELHTGEYAEAAVAERPAELERLGRAARRAADHGLEVHAGHGLTYENVAPVAAIPELAEVSIGHSVVARAIFQGMAEAVQEMSRRIDDARRASPPSP